MNNKNKALLLAYEKGYRITEDGKILNPNGVILKGGINQGYIEMSIRLNKVTTKFKIHRLQAFQKFGEKIFENNIEVRHLNGNKLDSSLDNIEIGTHSDNMNDINPEIRLKKALYASSFIKKYNYKEVKDYYNQTKSYNKVMKKFNISSKGTLYYILKTKD